eukprot:scaffold24022_cov168-Amphora_coffeaeformis.AAC.21
MMRKDPFVLHRAQSPKDSPIPSYEELPNMISGAVEENLNKGGTTRGVTSNVRFILERERYQRLLETVAQVHQE